MGICIRRNYSQINMTKEERLQFIKNRFRELSEMTDAVLPITKPDIEEEIGKLETFNEFKKEKEKQNSI
jgi:hypothetical protein